MLGANVVDIRSPNDLVSADNVWPLEAHMSLHQAHLSNADPSALRVEISSPDLATGHVQDSGQDLIHPRLYTRVEQELKKNELRKIKNGSLTLSYLRL